MVPSKFGNVAVTIQVGNALGDSNHKQAKDICYYSMILGLIIAVITAALSLIFRHQIAEIYTTELPVIELAASLMFLAALFQFSDAIQVISAGALRGYKDTKSILYITFFSYWVIGLSIGVILGITDWLIAPIGPYGFWIGIIFGLTAAAILLAWRLKLVQRRVTTT